ncbi:MAG: 7TM diverse intracellular signaling domain-containing protein [Brumimicrobium sp.]
MKYKLLCILLIGFLQFPLTGQIVLNDSTLNKSLAHKAFVLEDAKHEVSLESIIRTDTFDFKQLEKPLEIIDFNRSRWFVRFKVKNADIARQIMFETARPITDRVDLFEIKKGNIIQTWKSGDGRSFDKKDYEHRKNIFPINFDPDETKYFYLILESDGEVINLPLTFWEKEKFHEKDYQKQLFHGFYFGVLALVVFIFFFFYLLLRDISFLYYILYVLFQFLLQFSLEGFTFQYIFPNQTYWANNSVLLSAAGTVFFVILYATAFLKIKERSPSWNKYFNVILIGLSIITIMSLTKGSLHAISYPVINVLSLVGTVSIIYAIFKLRRKGYAVNTAFSLGFIILIAGAVVFILGNLGIMGDARISEMALKIGSGLEILALSVSMAQKYKELQEEKEKAQEEALSNLEVLVEQRAKKVDEQKKKIETQHQDILDSIKYAQRIQEAILPTDESVKEILPDSFVFYVPRDIVSGDFYFVEKVTTKNGDVIDLFAAVDCTGHGVPGAFMSFLGNNYLMQSTKIESINTPGEALDFLNKGIFKSLRINELNKKGVPIRDGMDLTLCGLNRKAKKLYFAGAKNSIIIITSKENLKQWDAHKKDIKTLELEEIKDKVLIEVKGDRHPIGLYGKFSSLTFTSHTLPVNEGDVIYSFSDGYIDQFGGPKNKKFGTKRFKKTLLEIHHFDMEQQKRHLVAAFNEWKGEVENLDDILVIGVRV